MVEKWKRAVVHLESSTDSEHFYDWIKKIDGQRALLDNGQITHEQFVEEIAQRSRDIRFHGTALFLTHEDRRFLLTARHVVWDERSAKRELEEEAQRASSWPADMRHKLLQSVEERAQNNIFKIIFRLPSFDEILSQPEHREFLMNLGGGPPDTVPYTFSKPDLDLALISLDRCNPRFADELQSLGYVPIPSGKSMTALLARDRKYSQLASQAQRLWFGK